MLKLHTFDRGQGVLDSQLLSSTTLGSFTISSLTILGTQDWDSPTGEYAILTIEDEQILCTLSESGGTLTATIATGGRGYNGTSAATHAATTAVYLRMTSKHYEVAKDAVVSLENGLISYDVIPTVTSATVLTVASQDVTAVFTAGRVILFKISSTWYRAIVRSSSFSTNTTINVTGDGLLSSGTITDIGFECSPSIRQAVDYELLKHATNTPSSNPPSGYSWRFVKSGFFMTKDSSGNVRFLGKATAAVSSSSGTLTLDCATANIFETTLTENVTTITMSNGVDGELYILRVKQHASAAKTVAVPATWRFGTTLTTWVMTTTVAKTDYITLIYNSADSKYDVVAAAQGY